MPEKHKKADPLYSSLVSSQLTHSGSLLKFLPVRKVLSLSSTCIQGLTLKVTHFPGGCASPLALVEVVRAHELKVGLGLEDEQSRGRPTDNELCNVDAEQ